MSDIKSEMQLLEEIERVESTDSLTQSDYTYTRYISMSEFKGLKVIALEFEPYASIAKQCGLSDFSIAKSDTRYYLFNINDGGHFPVCEIRPISTKIIKDTEVLKGLLSNRAYAFGSEISKELTYKI